VTLLAFVRIMTDPNLHGQPMDVPTEHRHVTAWLAPPNVSLAEASWTRSRSASAERRTRRAPVWSTGALGIDGWWLGG
jgi:hypothetical protein